MVLKEINLDIPGKGRVDLKFYIHFDAHSSSIGEIKIHTDFDSTLPRRAFLKQDNGIWKLFDEHPTSVNSEIKVVPEFLEDDVSRSIVQRILELQADEMN